MKKFAYLWYCIVYGGPRARGRELMDYKEWLSCRREDRKIRWRIYNIAFGIFGKTRFWPRLGFAIWN